MARTDRLADAIPGDTKAIREGVMEMRIGSGPYCRVYYTHRGSEVVILLAGGDKQSHPNGCRRRRLWCGGRP